MEVCRVVGVALLALFCASPGGCARPPKNPEVAWLVIDARDLDGFAEVEEHATTALEHARFSPAEAILRAVRLGSSLMLQIDVRLAGRGIRVEIAGACPISVAGSELRAGETTHRTLRSTVALHGPARPRDVGYDNLLHVEAVRACPEAAPGAVAFRQTAGPSLRDVRIDDLRFEARMPSAIDRLPSTLPWGVVPVSPRTAAEIVIEAQWNEGPTTLHRRLRVAAASRSRGLPNVGVSTGVILGGGGWTIESAAPLTASASLESGTSFARFFATTSGHFRLRDGAGRTLAIEAGRYDATPLDCSRAGCHVGLISAGPMTTTFANRLPASSESTEPSCMFGCHTTGELDVSDGGFSHLATELHPTDLRRSGFDGLPRDLRRLGGVTCLGCHGPSAIPEPSARWAILRADVCASCHDAPPRYGHVVAWRASRMAVADADPRTRENRSCARCHTTSGFLADQRAIADDRIAPKEIDAIGIACAACHAVHDPTTTVSRPSLRAVRLPKMFDDVPIAAESRACVACHASEDIDIGSPAASAASIFAGRGGLDPSTGASLNGAASHGSVARGCIGCHRAGPSGVDRGASHRFGADLDACRGCHLEKRAYEAIDRRLREDATALFARLVVLGAFIKAPRASTPWHATPAPLSNGPLGRAAHDVLMVLEDPAAGVHNAGYARALLEAARKVTSASAKTGGLSP